MEFNEGCGEGEFRDPKVNECLDCNVCEPRDMCGAWCQHTTVDVDDGEDLDPVSQFSRTIWFGISLPLLLALLTVLFILIVCYVLKRRRLACYSKIAVRSDDVESTLPLTIDPEKTGSRVSLATIASVSLSFTVSYARGCSLLPGDSSRGTPSRGAPSTRDGPPTTGYTDPHLPALQALDRRQHEFMDTSIAKVTLFPDGWDIYLHQLPVDALVTENIKRKISALLPTPTGTLRILQYNPAENKKLNFEYENRAV